MKLRIRRRASEKTKPPPLVPAWAETACSECKSVIRLDRRLEPGEVAAVKCDNCGKWWSFYLSSIVVAPVENQPLLRPYVEQLANGRD